MNILLVKIMRSHKAAGLEIGSRHSTTTTTTATIKVAQEIEMAPLAQVVCHSPPIVLAMPFLLLQRNCLVRCGA
jgi:hypothetical protein